MKIKDKLWLSFNNIKQDRNSILSIIMLIIAFSMLIPIIWMSISFYYEYESKIENNGYNNIMTVDYSRDGIYSKSIAKYSLMFPFALYDRASALSLIDDNKRDILERINSYMITIKSGKNNVSIDGGLKTSNSRLTLKFYDDNTLLFPSNINNDLAKQSGYGIIKSGSGFSDNSRGEIIVSEKWLKDLGYTATDVLNKTVSLSVDVQPTKYENSIFYVYNYILDNDNIANNPHELSTISNGIKDEFEGGMVEIFKDFTIVGIINNEYFKDEYNTQNDAHIWLTSKSLYTDDGGSYLPSVNYQQLYDGSSTYNGAVITYSERDIVSLSHTATDKGLVFPFFIDGGYESIWTRAIRPGERHCLSPEPITSSVLQLKNYSTLKRMYSFYKKSFGEKLTAGNSLDFVRFPVTPVAYESLTASNEIDKYTIILGVIGITILIATLFNYYNHLSFLSRRRIKFYGVMLTLGAKHKECKFINLMEVLILFGLAICVSTVLSLIICGIVSWIYKLSLAIFPVVIAIIIAISTLMSVAFSLISGYSRKKQSPSELMKS